MDDDQLALSIDAHLGVMPVSLVRDMQENVLELGERAGKVNGLQDRVILVHVLSIAKVPLFTQLILCIPVFLITFSINKLLPEDDVNSGFDSGDPDGELLLNRVSDSS